MVLIKMPEIGLQCCILGAGVVGLTTALKLQKLFGNNVNYTLVAELFNEETTSHVAAGLFRPATSFLVCNDMDITKKCIRDSYNYYLDYLNKDCGISEISGYVFSSLDASLVRNHYLEGLVPVYRQVTEEELNMCPGGWKYGSFSASLLIECRNYLPWAISQFKENGGKILKMKVDSLSDLRKIGKFDLLMNCSGLGAKKLFNDGKVIPIRGQVFKVQAPWLNHFYYGEGDTYIIPSAGGVTLGGTRQFGSWNTRVCKHDAASIWERCTNLVPKLADSSNKILKEMVGLRPHRDSGVRIDVDIMDGLKIVHNYGHGGYGVTSAPGTADLAVKLAEQLVKFGTSKL
ncbi:D-aspartate oxidase-like isoform X1 [Rhodnius prolixus]|uniref:D-aspartate oxidase-like isoform X1 n=2 Tax=Rhodnius prolixus TaxID=13249 RepID=UPI003D187F40